MLPAQSVNCSWWQPAHACGSSSCARVSVPSCCDPLWHAEKPAAAPIASARVDARRMVPSAYPGTQNVKTALSVDPWEVNVTCQTPGMKKFKLVTV